MDTTAIEKYSVWARRELIEQVGNRLYVLGLTERNRVPADAAVVEGRVLGEEERTQRGELLARIDAEGEAAFAERMAYTWFNRLAAIRYMEVNGFLPSRTRVLSSAEGAFEPQALKEAASLDLPGLDRSRVLDLMQAGDDEALFRAILLAQCDQLADCMPDVFEHLGAADELTLPDNLLSPGSVAARMVTDIPEDCWSEGVEILGWMYQFYVHELKRDYYDSKRKASADDVGPATQTFTPSWIVCYMVENSLGRLWMLNNPGSFLRNAMRYYVEPDGAVEDYIKIGSPEEITFCDPACGSGHILVYAFELLWQMYEECGYATSEIAGLILTKNLHGLEIDRRAAQYAVLQLTMKARSYDRRFFSRGVVPDICALEPVMFDGEERALLGDLSGRTALLDALEHLGECGSLLRPEPDDLDALRAALVGLPHNLVGESLRPRLESALASCEALARTFDVVVANPPYMGSSNFNPWMNSWIKKNYPGEKGDLCTCFIRCGMEMLNSSGYMGMATSNCWMFLSSYEQLRNRLIDNCSITSLVQLSVHGFKGIAAQVCTFTLSKSHTDGLLGGYIRLNDYDHHSLQEPKTLEAIANPDRGWFYRADADSFKDIPGSPIAYWAGESIFRAFSENRQIASYAVPRQGTITGNNELFLKLWWEPGLSSISFDCCSIMETFNNDQRWYLHNKGGEFRKWYGNNNWVIDWSENGRKIRNYKSQDGKLLSRPQNIETFFESGVTYTELSSGLFSARISTCATYNVSGPTFIVSGNMQRIILAYINSSVFQAFLDLTASGMHYTNGTLAKLPFRVPENDKNIVYLNTILLEISKTDWNMNETSWGFKKHGLI